MSADACVVRIEALEAFTALIEREIPELAGHTCAGQAPSSELERLPNLSIEPSRWMFDADQQAEHAVLPGNVVVYDNGNHEANCAISIMATSPRQRAKLEAKVISLFLGGEHPLTGMPMPGVLVFQISDCPEVSRWSCSFDLDDDQWVETFALDRRYESRIAVTARIPALSVRRPVYSISQLILGVAADPVTPPAQPTVDVVTINFDGSISPA